MQPNKTDSGAKSDRSAYDIQYLVRGPRLPPSPKHGYTIDYVRVAPVIGERPTVKAWGATLNQVVNFLLLSCSEKEIEITPSISVNLGDDAEPLRPAVEMRPCRTSSS